MKLNKRLIFTLLICALVIFTGCEKGDTETKVSSEAKTSGGTIKIAINRYETLNPLLNRDKDVDQMLQLVYDPIVEIGADLKTSPVLAKEIKVDDTCTSIDVVLKDVKFHDGSQLTAEDVVYSLDTLKRSEDDSVYKNVLGNIGTYKALDENTVRFYLRQVYSNPEYCLAFPVISKAYFTSHKDDVNAECGTGMFKITDVQLNQDLTLERNKSYFGNKPYIDGIKVILMPDEKTRLTAFKQKQIDIMFTDDMIAGQYTGNNSVKLQQYSTMYYDFLGFNFNNSTLANGEVRRIVAHAIDKKKIIEDIYYGYGKIADTMIHPNSFLYSSSASSYDYDLGLAKGLLGKVEGSLSFRLLVNEENKERVEMAEMIKKALDSIGMTITIDKVNYETYVDKITKKDFDLLLGGWHLQNNQDISFAFSSAKIYDGQNYISYKSDEMDQKLLNAYGQIGETKVMTGFEELQEFLGTELPYISIAFRENVGYLNTDKVGGELEPLEHNNFNGIENIYVKK